MSAVAIVQARMSSTRLPGKTLADVGGEPMLALLVQRLRRSRRSKRIVIATSTEPADDPIAALADELVLDVHRGSRDDVLTRLAEAARGHDGTVIRITADCPLIDPEVVDATVDLLEETGGCAYASTVEPRTYPDGLDVEALPAWVLSEIAAETKDPEDREHVTTAIRRDPRHWPRASLSGSNELADLRWTVDTETDLEFVRQVTERLDKRRYAAGVQEIRAAILAAPSLADYGGARRG